MSLNFRNENTDEQSLVDTHHCILSAKTAPENALLQHLQVGMPNPMDLLLAENSAGNNALLNHVAVEPASAPIVLTVQPAQTEEPQAPPTMIVEKGKRLSKCMLWEMLIKYYSEQGIQAWSNSVPNFVTSSVYMAEIYAENVLNFLTDYYAHLDLNEPVYIVEMATGSGRFSFHILRELQKKMSYFSRFKNVKIRYVMTDFTENNINFWRSHEQFAPYIESGMLDFAIFNPLVDQAFDLTIAGHRLCPEVIKNPFIAIGNYFFDSVPLDLFRVDNKVLKEGLITLERNIDGVDPASYPHIKELSTEFEYREVSHLGYYPDEDMNKLLNQYRHNVKNGTVLFPVGALSVMRNLKALSNQRLVLLSSDKAYTKQDNMTRFKRHEYAIHDGTFSYMVNYHAVGMYFQNHGGRYFHTTGHNLSVQTICCIMLPESDLTYENVDYLYQEKIDRSNPANSLCAILPGKERSNEPTDELNYILAQIRMQMSDPFIIATLAPKLVEIAPKGWVNQVDELFRLLETAKNNFYYAPGEVNAPFWICQVYYALAKYEQNLECLYLTEHYYGEDGVLCFLMGQSLEQLNRKDEALEKYKRALELYPDLAEAQAALEALSACLSNQ